MRSRPVPVTVAAILVGLFSLLALVGPLMAIAGGEGMPAYLIASRVILGLVGFVIAAGLWMLKRWGFWLTILFSALNILSVAPAVARAPGAAVHPAVITQVVVCALIIVLVVLPTSRRAFAASS